MNTFRRIFWINLGFTGIIGFVFGWVYGRWWLGMLIGAAAGGMVGWLLHKGFEGHPYSDGEQ